MMTATVDFPDDLMQGIYTHELLDQMMVHLKSMGVGRIFWNWYTELRAGMADYGRATLDRIGEPVQAAVPHAHRHGIELYAGLKPYNFGNSGTHPEGSPEAKADGVQRIGGTLARANEFLGPLQNARLRRRPAPPPSGRGSAVVGRIELRKSGDSPTRIRKENLQVWTSPDNYRYRKRDVDFTLTEAVSPSPREVRDYYGDLVTPLGAPVRTLTLAGLRLDDKYILITTDFATPTGDFDNTALGMIAAYGADDAPLPIVVATTAAVFNRPRDFRAYGLEFDSGFGPVRITLDSDNRSSEGDGLFNPTPLGGVIAFARGKNEYLPCTPCESEPEVREVWLDWVDRMLGYGVDGIDFRLSAHGSLTDEPHEYGYNEPVVEEFQRRHGRAPSGDARDRRRLAEIRGESYTEFLRQASARIRGKGKRTHVHLHAEAFRPNPCHGQLMGFPDNIHFDWRTWLRAGLVDSATLRASWWEGLEDPPGKGAVNRSRLANVLADPVVRKMLTAANEADVPVTLNRYIHRAVGIDEYISYIEAIFRDERFSGFDLYETANILRPTPTGTALVPYKDRLDKLRATALALGLA